MGALLSRRPTAVYEVVDEEEFFVTPEFATGGEPRGEGETRRAQAVAPGVAASAAIDEPSVQRVTAFGSQRGKSRARVAAVGGLGIGLVALAALALDTRNRERVVVERAGRPIERRAERARSRPPAALVAVPRPLHSSRAARSPRRRTSVAPTATTPPTPVPPPVRPSRPDHAPIRRIATLAASKPRPASPEFGFEE